MAEDVVQDLMTNVSKREINRRTKTPPPDRDQILKQSFQYRKNNRRDNNVDEGKHRKMIASNLDLDICDKTTVGRKL